jgi:mannose-6-phosphate isomerase-like protein (cupin superfamily)
MTKTTLVAFLTVSAWALNAAEVQIWTADELKTFSHSLASKMNSQKLAGQTLGDYGNHAAQVSHREADGVAELHVKQNDIFVVISGEASLVTGGEMVEQQMIQPGEVRARFINKGAKKTLKPGDIVHIPAGTPHQLFVESGKEFTYFVFKVAAQ